MNYFLGRLELSNFSCTLNKTMLNSSIMASLPVALSPPSGEPAISEITQRAGASKITVFEGIFRRALDIGMSECLYFPFASLHVVVCHVASYAD